MPLRFCGRGGGERLPANPHHCSLLTGPLRWQVEDSSQGRLAIRDAVWDATAIWLAWLRQDAQEGRHKVCVVCAGASRWRAWAAGPCSLGHCCGPRALLVSHASYYVAAVQVTDALLQHHLQARSQAWRRFPRREASAPAAIALFGQAAMDDYWDSLAGDARVCSGGCKG